MIKNLILLVFLPFATFAINVPQVQLIESLDEKKRGHEFLQLIWNTGSVITDVEMASYLSRLGHELTTYSENPDKHFGFLLLNDNSINAFAGPYGYIGVHSGMLLSSDSEAELAGVLSHEISHVTQNHLTRFSEKTDKQTYLMVAGMLVAALVDNFNASEAIASSTLASTAQQRINFTREHEWEADRIGTNMLAKSGFNPTGMAHFFEKLQDNASAEEFLRTHPLSINRISDSLQRAARISSSYRQDSFEYTTLKARLYYYQHGRIKLESDPAITHYMAAYQALDQQAYASAKSHVDQLLKIDNSKSSYILAGRIASKLGELDLAQSYFDKNLMHEDDEASLYYAAQAYFEHQKFELGVSMLRPFLRTNQGSYESYKLLADLYVKQARFDRSHMQSAQALLVKGKLDEAIGHYQRAKAMTHSQDLHDVITSKINALEQTLDLYNNLD